LWVALALGHGGHFIKNSIVTIFAREFSGLGFRVIVYVCFPSQRFQFSIGEASDVGYAAKERKNCKKICICCGLAQTTDHGAGTEHEAEKKNFNTELHAELEMKFA